MNSALVQLIVGGVGGGVVAAALKVVDKLWIDARITDVLSARAKLRQYARPLWLHCRELEFRLRYIVDPTRAGAPPALSWLPGEHKHDLAGFTKHGYFAVSTAYLLASVSAWIRAYQRDTVFLSFARRSASNDFANAVDRLKEAISREPSILYYHYFNLVGEQLLTASSPGPMPMPIGEFMNRLCSDVTFSAFYDQLFQFLKRISEDDAQRGVVKDVISKLLNLRRALEASQLVPAEIGPAFTGDWAGIKDEKGRPPFSTLSVQSNGIAALTDGEAMHNLDARCEHNGKRTLMILSKGVTDIGYAELETRRRISAELRLNGSMARGYAKRSATVKRYVRACAKLLHRVAERPKNFKSARAADSGTGGSP